MDAFDHPLEVVMATAGDLRQLLDSGWYTSVELVQIYLDQISRHNHQGLKVHAIAETAPRNKPLQEAMALDWERQTSGPRGLLHGIPITVQPTGLLSYAFVWHGDHLWLIRAQGARASEDAAIATTLRDAGCIVIVLANLSEWANNMVANLTSGWSAVGGQTQTPYVKGGVYPNDKWMGHTTTGGSSSGSAVGTTVGFSPLSIGSESDGSIVQPATRASKYSIKGTVGDVNMNGTMSGGPGFDSAGPLAKSVEDCADIMGVLLPGRNFRSHLTKSWAGMQSLRIGLEFFQVAA